MIFLTVAWSRDFISLMKSLVEDLPPFWRKHAVLTVEISSLFLWKSQNKGQWIKLHSFWFLHFTGHSQIAHQWGSLPERKCCRLHVFIYFNRGSSSFSFFSSFCWLSSLASWSHLQLCGNIGSLFYLTAISYKFLLARLSY